MTERTVQHIIIAIVVLCAIVLLGWGGYLIWNSRPELAEFYQPEHGLVMRYPADWEVVDQKAPLLLINILSPKTDALDTYRESVNITIADLSRNPDMTLEKFTRITVQQVTGLLEGQIRVIQGASTRLAGRPAYRFVWSGKKTTGFENPLKYLHVWTLNGRYAYIVTYAGPEKDFATHLKAVEAMIRSIRFEKRP